MSIGRQIQFPQLTSPPDDFVLQMEEYVKGATGRTAMRKFPSTVSRNARGLPSAALAKSDTGGSANPKIVVNLETTKEAKSEPDLLGLDALDLSAPPAPTPPAPAVADPFGDTVFQSAEIKESGFLDDWGQTTGVHSPVAVSSVAAAEQNSSPFDDFFGGGPMVQPPAPEGSSPGSNIQQLPPYNPPVQAFQPPVQMNAFQQPPVQMNAFQQPTPSAMGGFQQPVAAPVSGNPFGGFDLTPQPFVSVPVQRQQSPVPQQAAFAGPNAFVDPFEGLTPTIQKKPSYAPPGAPMRQDASGGNPFGTTNATQPPATTQQDFASFF